MHWLEKFKNDHGFESTYQLSKATGVYESTLGKIIAKDTPVENVRTGIVWSMCDAVGISPNQFRKRYQTAKD
jgi:DNA-binding Xre family transcriptional regulator